MGDAVGVNHSPVPDPSVFLYSGCIPLGVAHLLWVGEVEGGKWRLTFPTLTGRRRRNLAEGRLHVPNHRTGSEMIVRICIHPASSPMPDTK